MADRLLLNTPVLVLADAVERISRNGNLGELDQAILEEVVIRLRDIGTRKLSPRDQAFAQQRE